MTQWCWLAEFFFRERKKLNCVVKKQKHALHTKVVEKTIDLASSRKNTSWYLNIKGVHRRLPCTSWVWSKDDWLLVTVFSGCPKLSGGYLVLLNLNWLFFSVKIVVLSCFKMMHGIYYNVLYWTEWHELCKGALLASPCVPFNGIHVPLLYINHCLQTGLSILLSLREYPVQLN